MDFFEEGTPQVDNIDIVLLKSFESRLGLYMARRSAVPLAHMTSSDLVAD